MVIVVVTVSMIMECHMRLTCVGPWLVSVVPVCHYQVVSGFLSLGPSLDSKIVVLGFGFSFLVSFFIINFPVLSCSDLWQTLYSSRYSRCIAELREKSRRMLPHPYNAFQCNWACSLWNTRSGKSHRCWCSGHCDRCLGSPHIRSDLASSSGHRERERKKREIVSIPSFENNELSCNKLTNHFYTISPFYSILFTGRLSMSLQTSIFFLTVKVRFRQIAAKIHTI